MKFYTCEKLASLILGKCHAHETGKRERGFKFPTGFCHPMLQIEDPSQWGHHGGLVPPLLATISCLIRPNSMRKWLGRGEGPLARF